MIRVLRVTLLSNWSINPIGGTSLVAPWIRLRAVSAGGPGSIPGQGTRSHMHAVTKEPWRCN